MLRPKISLPVILTALLAASCALQAVQYYRLKAIRAELSAAQSDLAAQQETLKQATARAAALQEANRQMVQQMAAAQDEAAARRDALSQALQANTNWRDAELPTAIKELLKK